jgi:hypothetical protein
MQISNGYENDIISAYYNLISFLKYSIRTLGIHTKIEAGEKDLPIWQFLPSTK